MKSFDIESIDSSVDLKRRIAEAEFLVIYASQNGIKEVRGENGITKKLEERDFKNIIEAKTKFESGNWDNNIETKFFMSLRNIADIVKPVSIQSIKAIHNKKYFSFIKLINIVIRALANLGVYLINLFKKQDSPNRLNYFALNLPRITFAQKLTREFSLYTILIIIVLLFFQIKYIIGTGLYNDFEFELNTCDTLSIGMFQLSYLEEDEINLATRAKYDSLSEDYRIHFKKKESLGKIMDGWNKPWKWFFRPLFIDAEIGSKEINKNQNLESYFIFRATKYVLTVLYSYVLPLLYGLLGAACLILRNLFREIRRHTLTRDQDIRFYLRLVLGALSGLTIGWFFGFEATEDIISLEALSPLALAFLGGYSVDLLFSLLDGLLKKFTDSQAYATNN